MAGEAAAVESFVVAEARRSASRLRVERMVGIIEQPSRIETIDVRRIEASEMHSVVRDFTRRRRDAILEQHRGFEERSIAEDKGFAARPTVLANVPVIPLAVP